MLCVRVWYIGGVSEPQNFDLKGVSEISEGPIKNIANRPDPSFLPVRKTFFVALLA